MNQLNKEEKKRSKLQNNSLHLFCELLATELNDAGLDMRVVLKPEVDIPWTKTTIKEHIWKPIQQALTLKESTTEMNTTEPRKVHEIITRHLGEKFGVEVPAFPSEEETINYLQSFNQ